MKRNMAETLMGAVVLVVAGTFLYFFFATTQVKQRAGYQISATFSKVGGILAGSDVRISGINVGTVSDVHLDPKTFLAIVSMTLKSDVKLPQDSVATIASNGLIGGNYVRVKPGRSDQVVASGGMLEKSEDFKTLEDQVGEIIFLATGGNGDANSQ
jgi:phospholipid/cholesterol/gamma-HCH transport system substrate-binding protein